MAKVEPNGGPDENEQREPMTSSSLAMDQPIDKEKEMREAFRMIDTDNSGCAPERRKPSR